MAFIWGQFLKGYLSHQSLHLNYFENQFSKMAFHYPRVRRVKQLGQPLFVTTPPLMINIIYHSFLYMLFVALTIKSDNFNLKMFYLIYSSGHDIWTVEHVVFHLANWRNRWTIANSRVVRLNNQFQKLRYFQLPLFSVNILRGTFSYTSSKFCSRTVCGTVQIKYHLCICKPTGQNIWNRKATELYVGCSSMTSLSWLPVMT